MSEFNIDVGQKIFNVRKNLKMSRAELGKKVNLHESTVKRYEDGLINSLDIIKLKDFANALNVSPAYLVGLEITNSPTKNEEFQYLIGQFNIDNNSIKKDIITSLLNVHDENTLKLISDIIHKFSEYENNK